MYKQYQQEDAANSEFWHKHWNKEDLALQMKAAGQGELIPVFKIYIDKNGKILEAGCGQGIFVKALRDLGYDIEGIDFDKETIDRIHKVYPHLPVSFNDVFHLTYTDEYFDTYISLGVIEHYENDWRKPLLEAKRILKKNGTILISVPYYNLIRKLFSPLQNVRKKSDNKYFYQYLFTKKEILLAIKNAGFQIKAVEFYGKAKTLMSLPFLGKSVRRKYHTIKNRELVSGNKKKVFYQKFLKLLPNSLFAHMIMVVAKKKE